MHFRERLFLSLSFLLCLWVVQPLWPALAAGMVLAFLCEPGLEWILKSTGKSSSRSRWLAAVMLVSALQLLFIAPLLWLTASAAQELLQFWTRLGEDHSAAETGIKVYRWLQASLEQLLVQWQLPFSMMDIVQRLQGLVQPLMKMIATTVGDLLTATPQILLFLVVSWMAWVYFLVNGPALRRDFLPRLFPWVEERLILAETLSSVLKAMVLTSIVLAMIQSLLVLICLGISGIPNFLTWGALSFFLSFVPIFGTFPVLISASLYCFYNDEVFKGIFLLCSSLGIGLIDNILRPLLMKGSSEIGFFWLFLSLLGGVAMFGAAGVILGPWSFTLLMRLRQGPQAGL